MGPKSTPACAICAQASKYRCSACPVRYCSVACYKTHKQDCVATVAASGPAPSLEPAAEPQPADAGAKEEPNAAAARGEDAPLRALTSLRWPPEPDSSVFTDPLKRDDPKPLRHAELERIATSLPLRSLLAEPTLTRVLTAVDSLPTAGARHAALARLLGVDGQSLARPAAAAFLRSDSPPPLGELLGAAQGGMGHAGLSAGGDDWGAEGWWLGWGDGRVWVGEEERRLMRLWAGVVVQAIDEDGRDEWGSGGLGWEV